MKLEWKRDKDGDQFAEVANLSQTNDQGSLNL